MTDNNDELLTQQHEQQETLGPLLKKAREDKGLSVDEVAKQLHLRPCIVNDIEEDCFTEIASPTYVRGYVRNFARIVDVSESQIGACLERQIPSVAEPAMQSFSRKTSKQARDNRLMLVTYFIAALLLVLLVVWWVQKSELLSDIDVSQPTVEEVAELQITASSIPLAEVEVATQQSAVALEANMDAAKNAELDAATQQPADDDGASTAVSAEGTAQNLEPTPTHAAAETVKPAPVVIAETEDMNDGQSTLQISLTGDCWIKTTDAGGKVLINDLKKKGQVILVTGAAPFQLVLGAPKVVAINLDGQSIDMTQFPSNKVARITLPVQG